MALTESQATGPAEPPLLDITLGELLARAAAATPDRLALIAGVPDPALRRQWTYAELHMQSQRTARALRTRFKPGERVAVWAPNLPEWVMMEFGAAMAGWCWSPSTRLFAPASWPRCSSSRTAPGCWWPVSSAATRCTTPPAPWPLNAPSCAR